jgi:hypothetical protein
MMNVLGRTARQKGADLPAVAWPLAAFGATVACLVVLRHKIHRQHQQNVDDDVAENAAGAGRKVKIDKVERLFEISVPIPGILVKKTMNVLDLLPGFFSFFRKDDDHSNAETEGTEPTESSDESLEFDFPEPFRRQRITI